MSRSSPGNGDSDVANWYENVAVQTSLARISHMIRALENFGNEIRRHADSSEDYDRRMAESMAEAVMSDGPLVTIFARELKVAEHDEKLSEHIKKLQDELKKREAPQAEVDRQVAALIDRNPLPPTSDQGDSELAFLAKLAGKHVSRDAAEALMPDDILAAEYSASGQQKFGDTHSCVICCDTKDWFSVLKAPCGHDYCDGCLQKLFQDSMKDDSLFPPSCCRQVIPIETKELSLSIPHRLILAYGPRKIEMETRDRTYCHACNTFILPATIEDSRAKCSKCKAETCSTCKSETHTGVCKEDEATKALLELAKKEEWQQCFRCPHLVELTTGCNHMTCVCKAQWCYKCGLEWKSCRCNAFDEHRLLERAEQVLGRNPQATVGAGRDQQIQEMAERIRENHECEHDSLSSVSGEHQCEECRQWLPNFILQCDDCDLQVCVRCRRNRI